LKGLTYTAFGTFALSGDASVVQPYTFTGREWEGETGLYYYRARYYDPSLGRFLSEDPIGLAGGINLYAYVGGNPVNWVDPTGLWFGADDVITGPVDEIIVLGGLSILAMTGNEWAKNALKSLGDAISEALSGDPGGNDDCRDPCKGLREQLKAHQDKLKQYINDPFSMDNKGFLQNAPPERLERIFKGRVNNLLGQIENFKRQLEECERKNGSH